MLNSYVRWKESYVSFALNRKFAGVVPAGIYWGFEVLPAGGLAVKVFAGEDPDYPSSVAVVEREGYSLTVRLDREVIVPVQKSSQYIVLEAYYTPGQETFATIKTAQTLEDHHVVLAEVNVPESAIAVTEEMISYEKRTIGNSLQLISSLVSQIVSLNTELIDLKDRLNNLENWAKAQGYTA